MRLSPLPRRLPIADPSAIRLSAVAVTVCAALFTAPARAPLAAQAPAAAPAPETAASQAHVDAARRLAGADPWLRQPFDFYCVAGRARANDPAAPAMEPTKLFDNLYALGNSEATVYAVTTSGGIVLIDSGYTDQVETVVVPGLRALGLDPAQVKYVLVGHGHGDHFGGARYFQERGARVGLSAADWELVQPATPPATAPAQPRPARDLVLTEGQPVTLGEQTITPVLIPGHTPGSLAFTFQVRDGRQVHVAGLFGGTILTSGRITTPGLRQYVASIDHYLSVARRERVDVEVQNHPLFDDMAGRLAATRARKAGAPHPFVVGRDRYVRFWSIVSECMQAELARRVS